ncbi:MAG: hypothetical protein JW833_00560 [Prolixibacteraceae bacterium]|nr:hypothetical protein [Prolixibacteraceae bacterium]
MAEIEQLIDMKELKLAKVKSWINGNENYSARYDDRLDTLYIMFTNSDSVTIVHHLDENLALIYLPDTLEVVGVQIEDLKLFARKNRAIDEVWKLQGDCERLSNMGKLYAYKYKQEKKVMREVARVTQESLYGSIS